MEVGDERANGVIAERARGPVASTHTVREHAERERLVARTEHVAGERDRVTECARLRPDDAARHVPQASGERAVDACDREMRQIFAAHRGVAVDVREELREVRRSDEVSVEEPGTVHDGRGAVWDAGLLEQRACGGGTLGGAAGSGPLGADDLQDHLRDEVVGVLPEGGEDLRERRGASGGEERHVAGGGRDAHTHRGPDPQAAQRLDEGVPREGHGVLDAAPVGDAAHAERHRAAHPEHEPFAAAALVGQHARLAARRGGDLVGDVEVAARVEPHHRGRAHRRTGQDPQFVSVSIHGERGDRRAEGGDLAGLLLEGRREEAVVEVRAVDDDLVDAPHAAVHQRLAELDEVRDAEGRVPAPLEEQPTDHGVALDAAVNTREHSEIAAERPERRRRGDELLVGSRVQRDVGLVREEHAAGSGIADGDAGALAEVGPRDESGERARECARVGPPTGRVLRRGHRGERDRDHAEGGEQEGGAAVRGSVRKGRHRGPDAITRLRGAIGLLGALLSAALAAPGCARGEGDAQAADDGALVVVLPQDVEQLDPRKVGDAYGLKVSRLVFASLVTVDPRTLEVVPDLADRVEVESPLRYRVTLRAGLRFSDGSVLDAEDVRATFRSIVDPALGSRFARSYRRIVRLEVPDARTVIFELEAPHATFLTDLEIPILRAEDAGHVVGVLGGAEPIGAGPFRLVRRSPGHLELAANPRWHRGAPRFPRVRMVVVRDDNTRALRLLAGRADLALNAVPPLLVPMFEGDGRFRVRTAPGVGTTYLGTNLEAPALRDVRVRRALALAIDRARIVRAKLGGRARLASGFVPPGHWASVPGLPSWDFDPVRARALLDEAGLRDPDGSGPAPRLRLTLRTSTDRFRQSIARAIAAMLGDVGVEVEVRPSELATLLADLDAGRFELATLQVPEVFEPHVLTWFFGSEHVPGGGREGANRWRMRDAALDAALERGRATPDRAARIAAYGDAQRVLAAQLPVIPLWHEDVVAVTGARAAAFDVPRDGRFATLAD